MNKIVHENSRLKKLENLANTFAKASISEATKKAYETDWRDFWSFCRDHSLQYLPADSDTICLYLTNLAESGISVATIVRRCTSITAIHNASGFDSPIKSDKVGRVLRGIRNTIGSLPDKSKALSWSDVTRLAAKCGPLMLGCRNAAILLFGWASALRRSELCSINIGDLEIVYEGAILTLRRSKTDREGRGAKIGIPRAQDTSVCPVAAVERWIARRSKSTLSADEPLFVKIGVNGRNKWWWETGGRLSARTISSVVKHYAKLSGLNPKLYSAHSLRRGLATEAGSRGVPERIISRHTRHRSIAVLRGYIEEGTIWEENPLPAIYTPRSGSITGLDE